MKPLKWYIAQGIVVKIVEDLKAGTFKINEGVLLRELFLYSLKERIDAKNI